MVQKLWIRAAAHQGLCLLAGLSFLLLAGLVCLLVGLAFLLACLLGLLSGLSVVLLLALAAVLLVGFSVRLLAGLSAVLQACLAVRLLAGLSAVLLLDLAQSLAGWADLAADPAQIPALGWVPEPRQAD